MVKKWVVCYEGVYNKYFYWVIQIILEFRWLKNRCNASSKKLKFLLIWQAWVPKNETTIGNALRDCVTMSYNGAFFNIIFTFVCHVKRKTEKFYIFPRTIISWAWSVDIIKLSLILCNKSILWVLRFESKTSYSEILLTVFNN